MHPFLLPHPSPTSIGAASGLSPQNTDRNPDPAEGPWVHGLSAGCFHIQQLGAAQQPGACWWMPVGRTQLIWVKKNERRRGARGEWKLRMCELWGLSRDPLGPLLPRAPPGCLELLRDRARSGGRSHRPKLPHWPWWDPLPWQEGMYWPPRVLERTSPSGRALPSVGWQPCASPCGGTGSLTRV